MRSSRDCEPVSAPVLGSIKRGIRCLQRVLEGGGRASRRKTDAHRGSDLLAARRLYDGRCELRSHALTSLLRLLKVHPAEQHAELLAPETSNSIVRPDIRAENVGKGLEDFIPAR